MLLHKLEGRKLLKCLIYHKYSKLYLTTNFSYSEISEEVRSLQNENTHLKKCLEKEREDLKSMEKVFTEGQIRKLKTRKQIQWSAEDIASAISIYAGGPRSYKLLRKRGYPLPGVSTIRRWASKLKMQPGMLTLQAEKYNINK